MNALLDLLSPPCCALCNQRIPLGSLCEHCEESLPKRLWAPTVKTPYVDKVLCLGDYALSPGRLVRLAKYGCREDVAQILASALAGACSHHNLGIDAVVPVPQNWLNNLTRGFSLVDIMGRHVAKTIGSPLSKSLQRSRGQRLAGVPPHRRRAIAMSQFSARKTHPRASILLVDDVFTTGATASVCAKILKSGGAKEVLLLAAASPQI